MEKDKKRILIGAGILGGTLLAARLIKKGLPPPPPPPEGYGLLQGYIVNKNTGAKIPKGSAQITIDGTQSFYNIIDELGGYRTPNLQYGTYRFVIAVDNYVTGEFDLDISQPVSSYDFELDPLPEAPTPWTEGVTVEKITVDKPVAYLGEVVQIQIYIQYAYPAPLPADIHGTVLIDGQELTEQWTIDFRNPTLVLEYTATQLGVLTVRAQTKSTTLEVVERVIGTYYPPHGGTRFPVCTGLTVPNVAVLTPDGIVYLPGAGTISPKGNAFQATDSEVIANLPEAYPSAWSPPEAVVRQSEVLITQPRAIIGAPYGVFVFTAPTDYDCPPYWASKEELANAIASSHPSGLDSLYHYFPELKEWLAQFGSRIILLTSWRDWVQTVGWGHDDVGGSYVITLKCPYCNEVLRGTRTIRQSEDRLPLARRLLEHIEQAHSDHPLTQAA